MRLFAPHSYKILPACTFVREIRGRLSDELYFLYNVLIDQKSCSHVLMSVREIEAGVANRLHGSKTDFAAKQVSREAVSFIPTVTFSDANFTASTGGFSSATTILYITTHHIITYFILLSIRKRLGSATMWNLPCDTPETLSMSFQHPPSSFLVVFLLLIEFCYVVSKQRSF